MELTKEVAVELAKRLYFVAPDFRKVEVEVEGVDMGCFIADISVTDNQHIFLITVQEVSNLINIHLSIMLKKECRIIEEKYYDPSTLEEVERYSK